MASSYQRWRSLGITIVLLHALITVVHGAAHSVLQIHMMTWQNIYIFTVILALPLVALVLLWRRSAKGFHVLLLSMLGSLLFGGYYHFVLPGPDNVSHLTAHAWSFPFQISAVALAITEGIGAVVGLLGLRSPQ